jgi:hypothetical protein
MSIHAAPGAGAAGSAPSITAATSAGPGRTVISTSLHAAAAGADGSQRAPAASAAPSRAGFTSEAVT